MPITLGIGTPICPNCVPMPGGSFSCRGSLSPECLLKPIVLQVVRDEKTEAEQAAIVEQFLGDAAHLSSGGSIGGYAIVVWGKDYKTSSSSWDSGNLPTSMIPHFVEEVIRRKLLEIDVTNALSRGPQRS